MRPRLGIGNCAVKHWRPSEIRAVALEKILKPLWQQRKELARGAAISPIGLLPIMPNRLITELLRMHVEEPEEIADEVESAVSTGSIVGGVFDRKRGRFAVAGRLPLECRRFTLAHELGHYFLHPGLFYHRDVPLIGSERTEVRGRPRQEIEADRFAAEILMPRRTLCHLIAARYGGAISPDEIDEDLAFRLTLGAFRTITLDMLVHGTRRDRSRIIAMDTHRGRSLVELFLVSREAMAIQLEDLDLVF